MKEYYCPLGRVHIIVKNQDGELVAERHEHNDVTPQGRTLLARIFSQEGVTNITKREVIVGTNGISTEDILSGETENINIDAVTTVDAIFSKQEGQKSHVVKVSATLEARHEGGETHALQEAGILLTVNDDTNNKVLYNRVTFPVINWTSNLSMTLAWEVTF